MLYVILIGLSAAAFHVLFSYHQAFQRREALKKRRRGKGTDPMMNAGSSATTQNHVDGSEKTVFVNGVNTPYQPDKPADNNSPVGRRRMQPKPESDLMKAPESIAR